jgi:hypothetical protein
MPEPVSTLGLCYIAGYTALATYARGGNAVSSEALSAQKSATEIVEFVEQSQALFGKKAAAIQQMRALAAECSQDDWDGEGALAVQSLAVQVAENFIRALPDYIRVPELAPEPDGSISLDWIESRTRLFSVSVGATTRLAYAWLDGTDRGHGVARFNGGTLPPRILQGIIEITGHANTSLRAA